MTKQSILKIGKYLLCTCIMLSLYLLKANGQDQLITGRYKLYLLRTSKETDKKIKDFNHDLQPDGRWLDIQYDDKEPSGWKATQHLKRIEAMATVLNTPKSKFFHNKQLLHKIELALDHWLTKRYQSTNWWYNEIGVPQYMRDIIILLQGDLDSIRLSKSLKIMRQFKINESFTGGNLIWCADLGLHYAALTGDSNMLNHCRNLIAKEIKVTDEEGIQPDYSFQQHSHRLQMFHYGRDYLIDALRIAWELHNTPFAFPKEKTSILFDLVLNGWQWMSRGIYTVPGTIDRAVSRKGSLDQLANLQTQIPFMTELDPSRATILKKFKEVQQHKDFLKGFRYFPYSDLTAYQHPSFSFFLKTISTRTLPTESINHENLKGRLLNSGDAYLVKNGKEYTDLQPVWDWSLIPGVTSFKEADHIDRKDFSGSVSDGQIGLTAMDYVMKDSTGKRTLSAKKFWASYNNFVICLIGGLKTTNISTNAYTALDQCRIQGKVYVNTQKKALAADNQTLQNVRWIYHAGIAYIPLQPSTLNIRMGQATGSWYSINQSGSKDHFTENIFLPIMMHNSDKPLSTGYILASSPNISDVQQIVKHPVWSIISNDKNIQAVEMNDGTCMATFYEPGTLSFKAIKEVTVDHPCLIMIRQNKLYISNPTHRKITVKVIVNNQSKSIALPADGSSVSVFVDSATPILPLEKTRTPTSMQKKLEAISQ